jgi:hypothetical protein
MICFLLAFFALCSILIYIVNLLRKTIRGFFYPQFIMKTTATTYLSTPSSFDSGEMV